ncbi:hypothetical protein G6M89_21040 [Natronolimnobius sp. AArcel1]|uniref:hypothetical protein n=1 Tax=Natronolimnobius sp. AArcel1 TaxID=1679093 RepID=UPI0013EB2CEC|nr:hypothetical protein [Natronolimnobius sp. AArcel1]NGM71442.1 hypothetical protein [Natronolimnobius sp. AArcel1]
MASSTSGCLSRQIHSSEAKSRLPTLDLSKHRVAVRKQTERKNGLEYTERRLVILEDAEIPGEE